MPSLLAAEALLPQGWARDVLIEWDERGFIARVETASSERAVRAPGPVLPGMPNVHSHAFQRAMAGLAEWRGHPTDDFWTWREAMYALVLRLGPEDVRAIATHVYIELLKRGYTTVGEFHYLHHDRDGRPYPDPAHLSECIVEAAAESGIALTLLPVLYAHGGFGHKVLAPAQKRFGGTAEAILALLHELQRRHGTRERFRLGVAPHSVRAVDALMLTELLEGIEAIDATMPIHMHVSEQVGEVQQCLETHGTTPFEWIDQIAKVDERWCLIHGTHLTALERRRAAERKATLGLCPTTEANLGDGIFEFDAWFGAGNRWAIGGDSHVCLDPFDELRALECSQRLRLRLRNVSASEGAPEVATNLWLGAASGGAGAVGQPVGRIAPGARADLIVLDPTHADHEALAAPALLAATMFAGHSPRIVEVMVAGERVVTGGRHARESGADAAYREVLRRLRAR